MDILLERVPCAKADAEAVAQQCGEFLEARGFLVALVRVVWKHGLAIIAIHVQGRRPLYVLSRAIARRVQDGKTPSLFEGIAA